MTDSNDANATQPSAADSAGSLAAARPISGKLGLFVELMRRPQGADLSEMMQVTGWQQHSVRGALAGALKKHRGLPIVSEKIEGSRMYRIADSDAASPTLAVPKPDKPAKAKVAKSKPAKASAQAKVKGAKRLG
jgi:hypothetical protein